MIKAVIFDLDGVLVFTDHYHYLAWKAIADEEGIPFDESINNRLRGVSRMASLDIILEKSRKKYTEKEKADMAEKKNSLYRSYLEKMKPSDVREEVIRTLAELKKRGFLLGVGSSSKNAKFILEKTGLGKFFDAVSDGTMISHSKPNPEVFLKAASMLGISPKEAAVVEDAYAGIEAAKNGGFTAFGIGEASHDEEADYPLSSIGGIPPILERRNMPRLVMKNLWKTYPNGLTATKGFNLEVCDDEFVVLVGPSGCGKSTILRMIAGLEEVTNGEIYLDNENITDTDARERNIAMVFQNYALYPQLSVRQNIAFPLTLGKIDWKHLLDFRYRKAKKKEINEKVEAVAEKIGLKEYLDSRPSNLSGGQKQRVALGRAIIRNPKVFLLDEPLSNLDAKTRVQMRAEISRLHERLKTIFVYVTHDQVEAMTMGSKIVVLKDGIIQQVGTPKDVFLNPENVFVASFIGTPQINLFQATTKKENGHFYAYLEGSSRGLLLNDGRMSSFDKSYLGKTITMGIRPKSISIEGDLGYDKNQDYSAKISIFEQLGDETIVYASAPEKKGDLIISSFGLERFHKGESIKISFDVSSACFFSSETGKTLLLP
jgi:multiple sugar transport system ATP-binding protein